MCENTFPALKGHSLKALFNPGFSTPWQLPGWEVLVLLCVNPERRQQPLVIRGVRSLCPCHGLTAEILGPKS